MARLTINALSLSSVRHARVAMKAYSDNLDEMCRRFVVALANKGIDVAQANLGGFGEYITFAVDAETFNCGARAIMYATNKSLIHVQWIGAGASYGEADISPLLMAEFGSGLKAQKNPRGPEFGMGTGTFPGQVHAEDPEGWWYMDLNGEWHHSYGITPTMPMQNAAEEIMRQIVATAREIFGK